MEKWVLMRKGADFEEISKKFYISQRLASLIRNRGIIGDDKIRFYLHGNITELWDGMLMKDMGKMVEIIMEKIRANSKIRIIGDYDIDGVCATYILLEGLEKLGANVDSDIPNRVDDGYGLNMNLIERAKVAGIDTILTCDNGIAAINEIAYAKNIGMTVLVTDHHEVPYIEKDGERDYQLPNADAIVDPKQADCPYPFKGLCGAAVAYKLIEALYEAMGEEVSDVDYLMEMVAMATIGDVMDLHGENRILVKQGLEMMRRTPSIGLKSLIECTKVDANKLSTYHIGFVLGPCLNASGRLGTAQRALDLLRAKTKKDADLLAGDLKALNESRKEMTEKALESAIEQIEKRGVHDKVLVVYLPDCHESLAGIVAGRMREKYYRPVFVLTKGETVIKGSGRSIEAYNMYEEINKCKLLLVKFGGHKLAAGLSLEERNVEVFREMINAECMLTEEDLIKKVQIDMKLPITDITEAFIEELKLLEPFGKGNEKPIFAESEMSIISGLVMGQNRKVFKMIVKDRTKARIEAIYFGDVESFILFLEDKGYIFAKDGRLTQGKEVKPISFVYYPDINDYQGRRNVQIIINGYQ